MTRTGVLLMAFGGPGSLDEVEPFCTNLMGREPSPEVLERVRMRYLTIGGKSPLPGMVSKIATDLEEKLRAHGFDAPVAVGMRYSPPFIDEGVGALVRAGVDRVLTVSLSPFDSPHSSGAYREAVVRAAAAYPEITVAEAPSIAEERTFLDFLGAACSQALEDIASTRNAVLFSAHSLPVDEIAGAPYVEQLERAAADVARRASLQPPAEDGRQQWLDGVDAFGSSGGAVPWMLVYQSRGQRPGEWLGPDVLDAVRAMADASFEGVVFAPVGFATDHMETLYDLDVEASGLALDLGMEYERALVPNDSEELLKALLGVITPHLD